MAESRLQRWSRQKTEARKETGHTPPLPMDSAPSPEAQELAINETLSEQEILRKYHLPDPEAIELGTDITGFMAKEIPEFLRRKALRSLWRSNPVLAVLDGLNDYDEDFTAAATAAGGLKTLYRVGQGFVDKRTGSDTLVEGPTDEPAETVKTMTAPEGPGESSRPSEPEDAEEARTVAGHPETTASDPEEAPPQRYRPRMRFTS